jgi:RES domain-containing protein
MRAYRLTPKAHQATAFTGEGARLAGGRFNHKGTRVVYCSESRALAALEMFVNLDPGFAPSDLVFIAVDVPDALITTLDIAKLPAGWRDYPAPDAVKDMGTAWVTAATSAALLVPSAVMPEEKSLLLSPEHPDLRRVKIGKPSKFTFGRRMWKPTP